MADPVPKPPALDAQTMTEGWSQIKKPDGTSYAAYGKWPSWKKWADSLYQFIETNRRNLIDQKVDLDKKQVQINALDARVTALEEKPSVPFPASG